MVWGRKRTNKGQMLAIVDVGSSKVCCLLAHINDGQPQVAGYGQTASRGVRGYTITDIDALADAVGTAVHAAEQAAGDTVESVLVTLGSCAPLSHQKFVTIDLPDRPINEHDIDRLYKQCFSQELEPDFTAIHSIPVGYILDNQKGVHEPRGLYGQELGLNVHHVLARESFLRNIAACFERAHLHVSGFIVPSYAAGLACLVPDEMDMGTVVLDLGGGTTSLGLFAENRFIHADSVPIGGYHVTQDIARGLGTTAAYAERLKTLHGHAGRGPSNEDKVISFPLVGEDKQGATAQTTQSMLGRIICARLEELFGLIKNRLEAAGFSGGMVQRVVLTGGASQLSGIQELAQEVLGCHVRLGHPESIPGLPDDANGPMLSAVKGSVLYALQHQMHDTSYALPTPSRGFSFGRLGQWLRDNF